MTDLQRDISRFYHRWHAYEATLGADNGNILDFDFCPRDHLVDVEPSFSSRLEALAVLERLRADLAATAGDQLRNHAFLTQKLDGASAFLRALMGERQPFPAYLRATMGIDPEPVPEEVLRAAREELELHFGAAGIPFTPEGVPAFERLMVEKDMTHFEERLRAEAAVWVQRLQTRIGLSAAPAYEIEFAREDAYWANWIDGSLDTGIRLRVNLHPRITFLKGSETSFAAHEIGGHALNMLELEAACRAGQVDGAAMSLAVHSCEQFQFEGLAQSVMHLMADEGEIPEQLVLDQLLRGYHGALLNNAHIELEAGRPIDAVIADLLEAGPFLTPLRVLSDLRDRGRHPLYRCYVFVYAPSRQTFLAARALPLPKRIAFLRRMYNRLWTPDQIKAILAELTATPVERL